MNAQLLAAMQAALAILIIAVIALGVSLCVAGIVELWRAIL